MMTVDLCMFVGEKYYPWPQDFIEEAQIMGISKRVPRTAIPHIEPGKTRLVLIHPRALARVKRLCLCDLALELVAEHAARLPESTIEEAARDMFAEQLPTLGFASLLRRAEQQGDLKRIEEKYGIEYQAGVIGYAFLTGLHYVLGNNENSLPPDLEGVSGIEAVRMDYSA